MKTVKYLRSVTHPKEQQGEEGQVREVTDRIAGLLLSGGFVEIVEPETEVKEEKRNGNQRTQRKNPKEH